jgi:cold shock protein
MEREEGVITKYFATRGFGFIKRADKKDIFFHFRAFKGLTSQSLIAEGLKVSFIEETGPQGSRAAQVEVVSDSQVCLTEKRP